MGESDDESTRRILDGTAWNEFCDALKLAGNVILEESSPNTAFDRAEGFRYLSRLVRAGLEAGIEFADPLAPELVRTCHETIKMGADNPDNFYQNASISGKYAYRIRGTRGSVHYLGLGTYEGNYGSTGTLEPSGYLDDSQLELGPNGELEIRVSAEPQPGNWLRMSERTRQLVIRQTFLDKEHEKPAELRVERTDGPHAARPVNPRVIDRGLRSAGTFVLGCSRLFSQWTSDFQKRPNELPKFDSRTADAAGGVPHIVYYHGYWQLRPDQALLIEVTPPDCDYWNFQLNNHWMESLDYRYYPITLNKHSARYGRDGAVRIIVAHTDPGLGNWIDTCGHDRGTMCLRWVRASQHPTPKTRVVSMSELAQELR
ncbi:MAG TPA: DUF1214 domain-containing protein [Polyangiaceae bacterium]|nr:DUF1214 domain-containing protein [Polyangiaceae bacterium]